MFKKMYKEKKKLSYFTNFNNKIPTTIIIIKQWLN